MPTLNWIGKEAVVNHHREVPYHLLRCDAKLPVGNPCSGNVLTGRILEDLPGHDGPKVIYAEGCRLGPARLKRERITFKQVPYEMRLS